MREKIDGRAAGMDSSVEAVIGNYLVSSSAFKTRRVVKILNYPNVHPHAMWEYASAEAARKPEFSASWMEPHPDSPDSVRQIFEIESADYVLVGSEFARDTFLHMGHDPESVRVVPYGVGNHLLKSPPPSPSQPTEFLRLLFVGSLTQRKGISYLLQAAQDVGQQLPIELTVVGRGSIDLQAHYGGVLRRFTHLSQEELASEFQRADLFVFPSLVEGMGLVVLEAMANGLPVITTRRGPDTLVRDEKDGLLVEAGDADSISRALVTLGSDPRLRLDFARSAYWRARDFTWDHYVDRLLRELRSMGVSETS